MMCVCEGLEMGVGVWEEAGVAGSQGRRGGVQRGLREAGVGSCKVFKVTLRRLDLMLTTMGNH